jgi:hypothetical protein
MSSASLPAVNTVVFKSEDTAVKDAIASYLENTGIYELKLLTLKQDLLTKLPPLQVPGNSTLSKILRNDFRLSYRRLSHVNIRYRDPDYDDKRLWIARLMTQFIHDKILVICVDESNFRSEVLPNKQWQFQGLMRSLSAKP